jgi:hypothetical protein
LQNTEIDGPAPVVDPGVRLSPAERALRRLPADQLVAELERRGWTVTGPPSQAR